MKVPYLCFLGLIGLSLPIRAQSWQPVTTQNTCVTRHENAATLIGDSLYAVGGRGMKTPGGFRPENARLANTPCATSRNESFSGHYVWWRTVRYRSFSGKYPHETPIPNIYIYSPKQGKWRMGPEIPKERLRGSAGVVVYKNKIYVACGIIDGHYDGHVAWLDEYDPKTTTWKRLPDAPRTRDHITAAVVGDKLYLAGGRNSTARINKVLETTIAEVDVYDFKTGRWETLPAASNIPTQRAGATAVTQGGKIWIIGGETVQVLAHNEAEALDPKTNKWISGRTLKQGRHGTQAVVYDGKIYIVAGSAIMVADRN